MKVQSRAQSGVARRRSGWRAVAIVAVSALAIGGAALGAHATPSIELTWDQADPAVATLAVGGDPITVNYCTSEATSVEASVTSDADESAVRTFDAQTTAADCPADGQTISWDGTDDAGAAVPGGAYTLHVVGPDTNELTMAITVEAAVDPEPVDPEPTNAAPVAVDDSATVVQDTVLTVEAPGVLANDTDADDDALTAALVGGPANGIVELATDGGYVYTPAEGFTGEDSFTYVANDGQADSAPATVTISVTEAPVVVPEAIELAVPVIEGTPEVGQVLTASVASVTPAEAAVAWQWQCDDAAIADAGTLGRQYEHMDPLA